MCLIMSCIGVRKQILPAVTLTVVTLWDVVESVSWTSAMAKETFTPFTRMWQIKMCDAKLI